MIYAFLTSLALDNTRRAHVLFILLRTKLQRITSNVKLEVATCKDSVIPKLHLFFFILFYMLLQAISPQIDKCFYTISH